MNLLKNPINKIDSNIIAISEAYKKLPKVQSKAIKAYKSL
jgi:hypothetical protein